MTEKEQFVTLAQTGRYTIRELCKDYGISRKTGHKYLQRYEAHGREGLKLMDLPEAIDGLSMEKFTKGQYSARAFRTLSAGGSAWRKPR